jgi:ferredoxin
MQPEVSFERGYCRPECTKCSEVCPTGAILPITKEERSGIQIGHAVWVQANCIAYNENVSCNSCMRHCPVGAIQMMEKVKEDGSTVKIRWSTRSVASVVVLVRTFVQQDIQCHLCRGTRSS